MLSVHNNGSKMQNALIEHQMITSAESPAIQASAMQSIQPVLGTEVWLYENVVKIYFIIITILIGYQFMT